MSFPASLSTRTVKARFVTFPDGTAAKGWVQIVLSEVMQGPTDDLFVAPFNFKVVLNSNGAFSLDLPTTNDPQWTSVSYQVVIAVGGKTVRSKLHVPYNETGPIDLAQVLNLAPPNPGDPYIVASTKGIPGGVASLGTDGKVLPIQLPASSGGAVTWDSILDKPESFPVDVPVVTWADVQGKPQALTWDTLTGKPTVFAHDEVTYGQVIGKPTAFPPTTHTHAFPDVTDKPATYPPSAHGHATSDISGLDTSLSSKATTNDLSTGLAGKANVSHVHATSQVTGLDASLASKANASDLTTGLAGKADTAHTHAFSTITGKPSTYPHDPITWDEITGKPTVYPGAGSGDGTSNGIVDWANVQNKPVTYPSTPDSWSSVTDKPSTFSPSAHTHVWADTTDKPSTFPPSAHSHAYISLTGIPATFTPAAHAHITADVTDLDAQLSAKASTIHTHAYSSLTGIPSTFTPSAHAHVTSDVTGLDTALASKAASNHTHAYSSLTGIPATFIPSAHTHIWADLTDKPSTFTPSVHVHATSDVTGLDTVLAGKAATVHTHATSDVTGLDTALSGKASSTHTHTQADVSGLSTALSAKADQSAVTTALSAKADTTALSSYATTSSVTTSLSSKADASALTAYATTTALTNGLANKADTSALSSYATTSSVTTGLAGKSDTSHTHAYSAITGKPTLATVATSGSYNDLLDKPTIPTSGGSGTGSSDWPSITSKPDYLVDRNLPLRKWYAALANRHYSPAKIAIIGDSLSEGVGASAFGRGWVPMVLGQLRSRFPVTGVSGGQGFVASWDNPGYSGGAPAYSYPVLQNSGSFSQTQGFSLKANTLVATGDQMTYTFTGTSVHVWYIMQSTGGTFSVTIDGVVVQASVVTAGTLGRGVWTSAALTSGTHTIQVTRISGGGAGTVLFNGFRIFNGDEAAGIQIFNGSQSGLTSGQFAANATDGDKWATWLNVIQPQLVVIELGLNDWSTSTSMATFKTNLKSIITTVRAQTTTDPSIVIYAATEANSGSYASTYTQLHQVWEQVVAEDSKTCLFDVSPRIPAPRVDTSDGYYYDALHPSDKGHAAIADRMASFLSPQ